MAQMIRSFFLIFVAASLFPTSAAAQYTLFSDHFESATLSGYLISNLDGGVPTDPDWVSLTDSAWVIRMSGNAGNHTAVATSEYTGAMAANDWLVTPQVRLGKYSKLRWKTQSMSAAKPDSYEVYVSTSGQSVNGCLINFPVYSVENESAEAFTEHTVDLAAAGYQDQLVSIGIRLNSTSGNRLALDDLIIEDDSVQTGVSLTFTVDMSKYITAGNFNPATDTVDIAGTFNQWIGTTHILSMVPGSDSTRYTITIPGFFDGMLLEFKFRINSSWNDTAAEFAYGGPNRTWEITSGKYTFTAFYNEEGTISGTGPDREINGKFRIYPNPGQNTLCAVFPRSVNQLHLTDIRGKLIASYVVSGDFSRIETRHLPAGIYLLNFLSGSQVQATLKLVKID